MKLCRFGQPGQEKPGLVDDDGAIRDLSGVVADITVEGLDAIRAADVASLPVVEGTPRYGVPVKGIGKIVAIGLNYRDHAIESNLPIPTEPVSPKPMARSCSAAAIVTSAAVAPPSAQSVRAFGSVSMALRSHRSMTIPPSVVE